MFKNSIFFNYDQTYQFGKTPIKKDTISELEKYGFTASSYEELFEQFVQLATRYGLQKLNNDGYGFFWSDNALNILKSMYSDVKNQNLLKENENFSDLFNQNPFISDDLVQQYHKIKGGKMNIGGIEDKTYDLIMLLALIQAVEMKYNHL
jgi:hypothetical protein